MQNRGYKCLSLLSMALVMMTSPSYGKPQYETYLETWNDNTYPPPYNNCDPMATCQALLNQLQTQNIQNDFQGIVFNIAFASFNLSSGGVLGGLGSFDINTFVSYVHNHNGKVKIAFGGATKPWWLSQSNSYNDIPELAHRIKLALDNYYLDGADFDIEDNTFNGNTLPANFLEAATQLIQLVKQANPTKNISLTIPGQGWSSYWKPLAINLTQNPDPTLNVDYVSFMEYNIWIDPNVPGNNYSNQIRLDIQEYINNWKIPLSKMQLGIMPGYDDEHTNQRFMSLNDAKNLLANPVNQYQFVGMMTWDLTRDQVGANITGSPTFAFTTSIISGLSSTSAAGSQLAPKAVSSRMQVQFPTYEFQPPPNNGSLNPDPNPPLSSQGE